MELFLACYKSVAASLRELGLLRKALSAWPLIPSPAFFWETGWEVARLAISVLSGAAGLFLETGRSGHLTAVFIHETRWMKWAYSSWQGLGDGGQCRVWAGLLLS